MHDSHLIYGVHITNRMTKAGAVQAELPE